MRCLRRLPPWWPLALVIGLSAALVHCDTGSIAAPAVREGGGERATSATSSRGRARLARSADPADRCTLACAAAPDDARAWSTCYACKCKAALGTLPTAADLDCAAGDEIKVYRLSLDRGTPVETALDEEPADGCANPAMLDMARQDQCVPGSRLWQRTMPNGSIFKSICRRRSGVPRDATLAYDDYGVIGHNPATGATCFWVKPSTDDVRLYDGKLPDLDITGGDPAKVDAYVARYEPRQEGDRCVGCHDGDPFMYSSYLRSVWDFSTTAHRAAPYALVRALGDPSPVPFKHLVSPEAKVCTTCHRIANARTCDRWLRAATGRLPSDRFYQHELEDPNAYYPLSYWMPAGHAGPDGTSEGPLSLVGWYEKFRPAVDFIEGCCDAPDTPGCAWEPLPAAVP